jgi:drug/metabolite transporter (DMT)-like permease
MFLFLSLCVLWGIPYLLIKVAVADVTPATLVFLRTAIGAALLMPLAAARGEIRAALAHWRPVLAFTVVEMGVPWLLLSDAERQLPSSLSGLLIAAVPTVAAVLAAIVGHERLDLRRAVGLLVGFAGVGAMLGLGGNGGSARAFAEMAVVVVGYATAPLIVSRRLSGVPPLGVVATSLALCALGYAPFALTELPRHVPPTAVLASIAVLGVICTAAAFLIAFALIAEAGPVRATIVTYVNPAVAALLGTAVLGERFTVGMAVGFALILLGSLTATGRGRELQPAT